MYAGGCYIRKAPLQHTTYQSNAYNLKTENDLETEVSFLNRQKESKRHSSATIYFQPLVPVKHSKATIYYHLPVPVKYSSATIYYLHILNLK